MLLPTLSPLLPPSPQCMNRCTQGFASWYKLAPVTNWTKKCCCRCSIYSHVMHWCNKCFSGSCEASIMWDSARRQRQTQSSLKIDKMCWRQWHVDTNNMWLKFKICSKVLSNSALPRPISLTWQSSISWQCVIASLIISLIIVVFSDTEGCLPARRLFVKLAAIFCHGIAKSSIQVLSAGTLQVDVDCTDKEHVEVEVDQWIHWQQD